MKQSLIYGCFVCGILIIQVKMGQSAKCTFPDFLQNDPSDQTDTWYTNEMKGTSYHSVVFSGDLMVATAKEFTNQTSYGYRLNSFNRTCVEKIGEDNYIVSQEPSSPKEPVYYICMKFILRNQGVAQIKSGEMDLKSHALLCDEKKLQLNDWPLLRASFRRYRVPCPSDLIGSYYFYLYDPRAQQTNCQGYWLRPRLQIGCMEDEGLKFRFPPCAGYPMTKVEDLQCFASWNEKGYTYMIAARVDADQESPPWTEWCLRFPQNKGNSSSFTAYIFQDMKCDSAEVPDPLEIRHARMTMWPAEYGFCSDETDTCEALKPLGYCSMNHQRMNCLKTCGICQENEAFEPPCTFPKSLRGSWLIPGTDKMITIDRTTFKHPEFASGFKCVSKSIKGGRPFALQKTNSLGLNNKVAVDVSASLATNLSLSQGSEEDLILDGSTADILTYVVYSESNKYGDRSCKPRFTCLQLLQAEDNKFSFRLSLSSDKIPIVEESLCGETRFIDDYPPYSNRYRNRDMKLAMASIGVHVPVKCKIDARLKVVLSQMAGPTDPNCDYSLSDCTDPTMLELEVGKTCGNPAIIGSHSCLFSNDLEPDLYRIILTQNNKGNIFCWYIETLDKITKDFRIVVTSNKECSRHSYGMFLKFPENISPDFIFTFKGGQNIDDNLMGCEVNFEPKNITNYISRIPENQDTQKSFTVSELKESIIARSEGVPTFDPLEISVNAAQSGKSPSRHVKISEISGLESALPITSYHYTRQEEGNTEKLDSKDSLELLPQKTGTQSSFGPVYYDEGEGVISSKVIEGSSPRAINYDYTQPKDKVKDYDSVVSLRISSDPPTVTASTSESKIGLVLSQDDYDHYSTRIELPRIISSELLTFPKVVEQSFTTEAPKTAAETNHPLGYDKSPEKFYHDSFLPDSQHDGIRVIPASSVEMAANVDGGSQRSEDQDYVVKPEEQVPLTTLYPTKSTLEKLWETAPYAPEPSTSQTLRIIENFQNPQQELSDQNVAMKKSFGVRIIDSGAQSIDHGEDVFDSRSRFLPSTVTSQPPTVTTGKLSTLDVLFSANNLDTSTLKPSVTQPVKKPAIINSQNQLDKYLNQMPNFPTRPAYIKHTTKAPPSDSKTVPLIDVIMAGNQDYFSPSTSAANIRPGSTKQFVPSAVLLSIFIATWVIHLMA